MVILRVISRLRCRERNDEGSRLLAVSHAHVRLESSQYNVTDRRTCFIKLWEVIFKTFVLRRRPLCRINVYLSWFEKFVSVFFDLSKLY